MLLVFAVAHGPGGWTTTRLLLTGIVVAAGCGAVVSLLLSLSDDLRLRGMLFWLLGDFAYVRTPWSLLTLALGGGTLLVVADLLARTIVAPRQLPVGALTALIGVPLFLLLMRRQRAG
jgi:iron complex transport system permease protein